MITAVAHYVVAATTAFPSLETNTTWNINQPINHDQTGSRRFQTNLGDCEEITLKQ
jgi:hypothetical protein